MTGPKFGSVIDFLTGGNQLKEVLGTIYTGHRLEKETKAYRAELLKRYGAVVLVTVILAGASALSDLAEKQSLTSITRPDFGESSLHVPLEVSAQYKGTEVTSRGNLTVNAEALSRKEKEDILTAFGKKLGEIVPKDENGVRRVTGNLNLPEEDRETGIHILWTSSEPDLLSEEGRVNILSLNGSSRTVVLTAQMTLSGVSRTETCEVVLNDAPDLYEISVQNEIASTLEQLSMQEEGSRIDLPKKSKEGLSLQWTTPSDSNAAMILILGLIVFLCLYSGRCSRARSRAKKYRDRVVADFPDAVDKLVLLINSGLTVFSALMKLSEASETDTDLRPIEREMAGIGYRVKNTNSSVIEEWKRFASRMESGDILRFCTILQDNLSKGSELSRKLENESDNLRDLRKKNIQIQIRAIDSKMMIPMMVMLFSLIMITISPVITGF